MATTTRSIENSSRIISFDYKNKTALRARGCFVFTCLPPSRQLCWTAAFLNANPSEVAAVVKDCLAVGANDSGQIVVALGTGVIAKTVEADAEL